MNAFWAIVIVSLIVWAGIKIIATGIALRILAPLLTKTVLARALTKKGRDRVDLRNRSDA